MMMFLVKERFFLYLTSLQTFYSLLYYSILVLTLMVVQQHVPLIVRVMLLGTKDRYQIVIPLFEP